MDKFTTEFTVLILIYMTGITTSKGYEIFRRKSAGYGGSREKGTDSFRIPHSLCRPNETSSVNCAAYNALPRSDNSDACICSCSNENATFINNTNWRCVKNSDVRDLLGE